MPRRYRSTNLVGLVIQFAGIVFLLGLFSPQVRQAVLALGVVVVCILAVALTALIGFGVYRLALRAHAETSVQRFVAASPENPFEQPKIDWKPLVVAEQHAELSTTADFIERLRSIDWFQFEQIVALVYQKLGYSVTRRGGANPDGGIDLIIEKEGNRSAIQCKHWKSWNVGVRAVREFLGALTHARIEKGIFITLCGYSGDAKELAEEHDIEIINESDLALMLDQTDARFDPEALEILNDSQKFCPKCGSEMVLRTARKGIGAGRQFWGCSAYPRCRFILREGPWRH